MAKLTKNCNLGWGGKLPALCGGGAMKRGLCMAARLAAAVGLVCLAPLAAVQAAVDVPSFEVAGEWTVKVSCEGASSTFEIDPPVEQDKKQGDFVLPRYNEKAWFLSQGKVPKGLVSRGGCPTKHALVVDSVRVVRRDGTELKKDVDWRVNEWGCLGSVEGGRAETNEHVSVTYRHRLSRADSVWLKDGKIVRVAGKPDMSAPEIPGYGSVANGRFLGTIYVPPETTRLSDANLFPRLEEPKRPSLTKERRAAALCPKTWRKLVAGEPVRILAWGDSVTDGVYAGLPGPSARWQEQFRRRLAKMFPKSRIEVVSNGWGGKTTQNFFDAPPSDTKHHYATTVVGAGCDLAIVEFVNDAGRSYADTTNRFGRIAEDFRTNGTEVVFMVPHYTRYDQYMGFASQKNCDADTRTYSRALKDLGVMLGVGVVDAAARWGHLWREGVPYMAFLVNDINHPTEEGLSFFADALVDFFDGLPDTGYEVSVDGCRVEVESARCSAVPFNRMFQGYQRSKDQTEFCAFARFDLDRPSRVDVKIPREFTNVVVKPLSRNVKARRADGMVSFEISSPGAYSVEADGPHECLFVFADAPHRYDVSRDDPKVRWFGPGEHNVGCIEMKSGETLYIESGATVYGRVFARDADGIRILGDGILDASREEGIPVRDDPEMDKWERENGRVVLNVLRPDTIRLEFCDDVLVEGVTIRDSLLYNIRPIGCRDLRIRRVKTLGNWRHNSDGFDLHNCERVTIADSFLRTFDDCICVKGFDCWMDESDMVHDGYRHEFCRDILVTNCVVWCDWGRALEIGAETRAKEISGVRFVDCDVIRAAHVACDVQNVDYGDVHDIAFENIRVEYDAHTPRLRYQKSDDDVYVDDPSRPNMPGLFWSTVTYIPCYSFGGANGGALRGRNRNIMLRNIRIFADRMPSSILRGYDEGHKTSSVVFDGVYLNGRRVERAAAKLSVGKFAEEPEWK